MVNYKVSLRIYSKTYSALDIDKLLGLVCDESRNIGEPRAIGASLKWKENVWILNSNLINETPLDEQLLNMFDRIGKQNEMFKSLPNDCEIGFECIVEGNENPELNFPMEIIRAMANIKAFLDIDLQIIQ